MDIKDITATIQEKIEENPILLPIIIGGIVIFVFVLSKQSSAITSSPVGGVLGIAPEPDATEGSDETIRSEVFSQLEEFSSYIDEQFAAYGEQFSGVNETISNLNESFQSSLGSFAQNVSDQFNQNIGQSSQITEQVNKQLASFSEQVNNVLSSMSSNSGYLIPEYPSYPTQEPYPTQGYTTPPDFNIPVQTTPSQTAKTIGQTSTPKQPSLTKAIGGKIGSIIKPATPNPNKPKPILENKPGNKPGAKGTLHITPIPAPTPKPQIPKLVPIPTVIKNIIPSKPKVTPVISPKPAPMIKPKVTPVISPKSAPISKPKPTSGYKPTL